MYRGIHFSIPHMSLKSGMQKVERYRCVDYTVVLQVIQINKQINGGPPFVSSIYPPTDNC